MPTMHPTDLAVAEPELSVVERYACAGFLAGYSGTHSRGLSPGHVPLHRMV
jgi:hypothetical protein